MKIPSVNTACVGFQPLTEADFKDEMLEVFPKAEKSKLVKYPGSIMRQIENGVTVKTGPTLKKAKAEMMVNKANAAFEKTLNQERQKIIDRAYILYQNSFKAHLPLMVIGGEKLRSATEELQNFGTLSEEKTACSARIRGILPEEKKGSILCDGSWNILKNDAYVLGAIHAKKTFYVFDKAQASGKVDDEILWDADNKRPHIMGREIAMIYASGYRQVASRDQVKKCGAMFVCLDPKKAESMIFETLMEAAEKVETLEQIHQMFDQVPDTSS